MRFIVALLVLSSCRVPDPLPAEPTVVEVTGVPEAGVEILDATSEPEPDDYSVVLGYYETRYASEIDRGKNIEQAKNRASLVRLGLGDEFSFNLTVGPRTKENGFFDAPVINKGELDKGIGGGVCQVSSTIHAAALMAGLEVTLHTPHSRPSKYMPPGLDATVGFPEDCKGDYKNKKCYAPDLRLRNNLGFPVQIVVSTIPPKKKWGEATLRVEVQGRGDLPPRPSYTFGTEKNGEFERKVKKIDKPSGYMKQLQPGSNGLIVKSWLKVDGGVLKTFRTVYPPTDEVWEVSEDFPESGPQPWEIPIVDAGADGG
jgi:hypothetical protein